MAAGALLVREAGGLVTDLGGEEKFLENGHILATNAKLFASTLKLLHEKP
jgi:myo-inositol-1(or 4)-monophosphatase